MAKDPAVLWYFSDWLSGTATLTRHQQGCYMAILSAQFNSGPLSLEKIKTVLGCDFSSWGALSEKFKQTEEGLFFNERLESEKAKRKSFVESRRNNLLGKSSHMDTHTGAHKARLMENENEDENKVRNKEGDARGRFLRPELAEVRAYCQERGNRVDPQAFLDHYDANGWVRGKTKIKDWRAAVRTWEHSSRQSKQDPEITRLNSLMISGGKIEYD